MKFEFPVVRRVFKLSYITFSVKYLRGKTDIRPRPNVHNAFNLKKEEKKSHYQGTLVTPVGNNVKRNHIIVFQIVSTMIKKGHR